VKDRLHYHVHQEQAHGREQDGPSRERHGQRSRQKPPLAATGARLGTERAFFLATFKFEQTVENVSNGHAESLPTRCHLRDTCDWLIVYTHARAGQSSASLALS
jgi:hypothetical protein